MPGLFIFLLLFVAGFCELAVGNLGLFAPLLAVAVFYAGNAFRWEQVLPLAVIVIAAHEAFLARQFAPGIVLLAPTIAAARLWTRHGNREALPLQALPGAAVGLVWGIGVTAAESLRDGALAAMPWRHHLWLLLQAALAGALALPLICAVCDRLARKAFLPRYARAAAKFGMRTE